MHIEEVTDSNGLVLAILISSLNDLPLAHTFPTNHLEELQLGLFNHKKDHEIKRHYHPGLVRNLKFTTEVLIILKGVVEVDIYDESMRLIKKSKLCASSVILLRRGGHGFSIIEDAIIVEVKQGPYAGPADKVLF